MSVPGDLDTLHNQSVQDASGQDGSPFIYPSDTTGQFVQTESDVRTRINKVEGSSLSLHSQMLLSKSAYY